MKIKEGAFTLVELMVTVSILAVGIVLVLRSFLSISAALDSGSNRIIAMQLLEEKMNALEQKAKEDAGVFPETKEEQARIGNRNAILKLEVVPLSTPEFGIEVQEEDKDKDKINEVKLMLLWKEANIDKDSILITYLKNKEI
jgi:prepilin-type N-terminal cleavage/methylation domain-containing protein